MLAWPLTLWISVTLTNRPWKAFYSLCPFPKSYCIPSLLAGFGLCILLGELTAFIPMPDFVEEFFLALIQGNRIFAFLGVCLLAPMMEELFFRGFVFRNFLERYSFRKAVVVSSVLFALFHLNPWQAIVAFGIGLLNAWLVLRSGSVVPGMLAHFATNFTSVFLLFPLGVLFGFSGEDMIHHDHFPWQILLVGAVSAAAGLLWLLRLKPAASDLR
jgi:membrane protease YdiL (CAAX protease family)